MKKPKPIPNPYNVPKRQWKKWTDVERILFNVVTGAGSDPIMWPDSLKNAKPQARRVLAWNLGWIAADCLRCLRQGKTP